VDSVTQVALGAAVGVAAMGRRVPVRRAALWGGVCGTLPDLDVLFGFGDPIADMTFHRADSHALFWLTLVAPGSAWAIARVHREPGLFRAWWFAVWAVLVTHALLDAMTVYGTQLLRPFSDHPFGVGSIFIIDPLYTLPLIAGTVAAMRVRGARGLRWNTIGLAASTAYLAWGIVAQAHVRGVAHEALAAQGIAAERVLVTPTPFNTVLWRVVAMTPDGYHEGFRSLLDRGPAMHFDRFDRGATLRPAVAGLWGADRIAWFSRGFFALSKHGERVAITDLRMGQEPNYTFSFAIAERSGDGWTPLRPSVPAGGRGDLRRGLAWLGPRMLGQPLPPPR
jgi:inner membrane protein